MAEIYMCIFKALNWNTLVQQHRQNRLHHHNYAHVMLCFIILFLMTEKNIMPQLMHTKNISLIVLKKRNIISEKLSTLWENTDVCA